MVKYHGIKKYYPRLQRFFGKKLTAYIRLCRPFTGLAPLLVGLFGVLAPLKLITFESLKVAIYVGVTLMATQFTGQIINQYVDIELDKGLPEKKNRPIPSGLVTREEALGIAWLLALFSIGRAFATSSFFGLIVLTLLFFAVFYSLAPFSPRKIHPLLNTGWMALSRGFLPMLAVWSVYGDLTKAWQYGLLAFLWVMGFQGSKDVPDLEEDKKHGIKTIVNTWGVKGLIATMITTTVIFAFFSIAFKVPLMLILLPLGALAVFTVRREASITENTYSWICFYGGLGLLYLLMLIIEMFLV